jgi:3-oxoacyl-[acyl-carrier-protein] synthase-3
VVLAAADRPNPFGVLGAMALIERLGAEAVPDWRDALVSSLDLAEDQVRFLSHHATADDGHLAVLVGLLDAACRAGAADDVVDVARTVARCYVLQLAEMGRSS